MADHDIKLKKIPVDTKGLGEDIFEEALFPPSFHVYERQMPEIEAWEVGEIYRLVIDVEQISKNSRKKGDKVVGTDASFEIRKYKWIKEKALEEMTDKEFSDKQGGLLAGSDHLD